MRKDRGAGAREIRGPEGYGTRGWKGWEEGVLKEPKKGEFTRKCLIFRNRKRAKGRKPKKKRWELGTKGTGGGRFGSPPPSPMVR